MLSLGMEGKVERIFIAPNSGEPMIELESVEAVLGCGLRGDRYLNRTGHWSGVDECQVTLIEAEILERIAEDTGLPLLAGEHRRNLVTRGVRLPQLLGKQFAVGQAVFEFHRPRPPCSHLHALTQAGTASALFGQRGGIGARVVRTGLIQVNDLIAVVVPGQVPTPVDGLPASEGV
jgi:MOSC domain-containing protein YiiM